MIRNFAKAVCLVALGFAAGVAIRASISQDLQFEFGQCRFGQAKNGTYYDKSYNHRNYLTPRCASIGIAGKFRGSSAGYRVAFIQSGSVEARDNIAPHNDGIYSPYGCNQDGHIENCHSYFSGSGRMQGFSFSLTREHELGRGWWARGEIGLLFYRHYFNGSVRPIDFDRNAVNWEAGGFKSTGARIEGGGLDQHSGLLENPLPLIGASVGWKWLYGSARYYFPAQHRQGLSITDQSDTQLSLGVSIPLRSLFR